MNVVGAIRQLIIDNIATAEGTLLNGKIYLVVVLQSIALPAVAIRIADNTPLLMKDRNSDNDRVLIEVMTHSYDYYQAEMIDEQIRLAIDEFQGIVTTSDDVEHGLNLVEYVTTEDGYVDEVKAFVRITKYSVAYLREVPSLPFGPPWTNNALRWFESLPKWNSDEEAELNNDRIYLAGSGHDSATRGTLIYRG
jgi:hypothetical protein